ncbi:MAG: PP2C family serine/threonine-protein phosphatase [Candidatus Altimarinota bacterium]
MQDQYGNILMPFHSAEIIGSDDDLSIRSIPFPNQTVVSMATERGEAYRREGKANQDRVATGLLVHHGELITLDLICDGLGGYENGSQAAQLCCDAFVEICTGSTSLNKELELPVAIADHLIKSTLQRYEEEDFSKETGTTMTLAVTRGSNITLLHLGDSPGMILDPSANQVLTRTSDHKPPEFEHRFRLTHYLHRAPVEELLENLGVVQFDLRDSVHPVFIILCSDGVSDNLKTSRVDQDFLPQFVELARKHASTEGLCEAFMSEARKRMELHGTEEGLRLDVKPDNASCLVRFCDKKRVV